MEFWHVMNRGVDKRSIVLTNSDRVRFVRELISLNDTHPNNNTAYFLKRGVEKTKRERLVTIHAWCLMGNHYHLLISECSNGGMSEFLKRLNGGYSRYFNKRHGRSGALFQGKTKRVLIENDRQFLYILPYIHLNPLDLAKSGQRWRSQCVADPKTALTWVTDYRWSSFRNYAGENEFAEILEGSKLFSEKKVHARELKRFLRTMPDQTLTTLNLE